jgi:hypothetical protein
MRNSSLGRACFRRFLLLKTLQKLSTGALELIIGTCPTVRLEDESGIHTSSQTARAQIIHLSGQYQFFHRYSQAHDCPDALHAS